MSKFYKLGGVFLFCSGLFLIILLKSNSNFNISFYKHYYNSLNRWQNRYAQFVLKRPFPVSYMSLGNFESKLAHPAAWIAQQINKDFSNYKVFSKAHVLDTYHNFPAEDLIILFQIENGELKVTRKNIALNEACTNGLKIYTHIFKYLAEKGYVKNLSFLLRLSDFINYASEAQVTASAPILTTSKDLSKSKEQRFILIPDYMSLEDIPKFASRILHANNVFPWSRKENKIFWRGGHADISGFRHRVVEFSQKNPNSLIDAQFTENSRQFVLPEIQVKFKYLLNIDGHTAAWTRPIWQLLSNSVMLKQDSSLTQWYYDAIQSGIHYISVNSDPAQLESAIKQYSDAELQTIANNGSEFAQNNLMFDDMLVYLVKVLQKYENLQTKGLISTS